MSKYPLRRVLRVSGDVLNIVKGTEREDHKPCPVLTGSSIFVPEESNEEQTYSSYMVISDPTTLNIRRSKIQFRENEESHVKTTSFRFDSIFFGEKGMDDCLTGPISSEIIHFLGGRFVLVAFISQDGQIEEIVDSVLGFIERTNRNLEQKHNFKYSTSSYSDKDDFNQLKEMDKWLEIRSDRHSILLLVFASSFYEIKNTAELIKELREKKTLTHPFTKSLTTSIWTKARINSVLNVRPEFIEEHQHLLVEFATTAKTKIAAIPPPSDETPFVVVTSPPSDKNKEEIIASVASERLEALKKELLRGLQLDCQSEESKRIAEEVRIVEKEIEAIRERNRQAEETLSAILEKKEQARTKLMDLISKTEELQIQHQRALDQIRCDLLLKQEIYQAELKKREELINKQLARKYTF